MVIMAKLVNNKTTQSHEFMAHIINVYVKNSESRLVSSFKCHMSITMMMMYLFDLRASLVS